MTLFRFDLNARSRSGGRLIGKIRRELLKAVTEEKAAGMTQQDLAHRLETQRAKVNRQLSGEAEISLRSLAELAWALGREVSVELKRPASSDGQNAAPVTSTINHRPIKVITPKSPAD